MSLSSQRTETSRKEFEELFVAHYAGTQEQACDIVVKVILSSSDFQILSDLRSPHFSFIFHIILIFCCVKQLLAWKHVEIEI